MTFLSTERIQLKPTLSVQAMMERNGKIQTMVKRLKPQSLTTLMMQCSTRQSALQMGSMWLKSLQASLIHPMDIQLSYWLSMTTVNRLTCIGMKQGNFGLSPYRLTFLLLHIQTKQSTLKLQSPILQCLVYSTKIRSAILQLRTS